MNIMFTMANSRDVLRRALAQAPCSVRALAREAGLSPALLAMIASGERRLTPEAAEGLAAALDAWGERCVEAAALLRKYSAEAGRES